MAERVANVRALARLRGVRANAALPSADLEVHAPLTKAARDLLERQLLAGALSARGLDRVRRVALTLADLDPSKATVDEGHVAIAARAASRAGGPPRRTGGVVGVSVPGRPPARRSDPPDVAYAVALAGLSSMTPQRMQRLLRGRSAAEVFADLRSPRARLVSRLMCAEQAPGHGGVRAAQIVDCWRRAALQTDPDHIWKTLAVTGTTVCRRGESGYPVRLVDDRAAPEVLFARGSTCQLERPCVAVVGTRSATYYGASVAAELGADLSEAGVVVISGSGGRRRCGGSRGSARARTPDSARRRRGWRGRCRLSGEQPPALGATRGHRRHSLGSPARGPTGGMAFPASEPARRRASPMSSWSSNLTKAAEPCTPLQRPTSEE